MTTTAAGPGVSHQMRAVGAHRVDGPLKGYHHQTFAVRLDRSSPLAKDFRWLKLREPRPGVFWYDLRWFSSEELVLRLLHAQPGPLRDRIPTVGEYLDRGQPVSFLAFIEGVTLDRVRGARNGRVAERFLRQIEDLFGALAAVDPEPLARYASPPPCGCADPGGGRGSEAAGDPGGDPGGDRSRDPGGSTDFLRRLTHFTTAHAYQERRADIDELLGLLEVPADALSTFARRLPALTDRPSTLLHGDLHRKNLVVDRAGTLWTIDWELALIGDPLYDLATHLHLMAYQDDQERDVVHRWRRAVGAARSAGLTADLPHYRAYKRVQSLCTDVLRAATRLSEAPERPGTAAARTRLRGTSVLVHKALEAAREPLGLEKVPPPAAVEAAFHSWWHRATHAAARAAARTARGR